MIKSEELEGYLSEIALTRPNLVSTRLNRGSLVQKGLGAKYEIDDPEIDRRLGSFPEGSIPYGPIHRRLQSSQGNIMTQLFNGRSVVPFSEAYNAQLGECLEKAVLVQLAAQRSSPSSLINGVLSQDGQIGADFHAFNIVFKDGTPFLVDAQNPLAKDSSGNITHPYIAPVLGIEDGDFRVPSEWRQGRTYSLT